MDSINDRGLIYLTQTNLDGKRVIRFQIGQFDCIEEDIAVADDAIVKAASDL